MIEVPHLKEKTRLFRAKAGFLNRDDLLNSEVTCLTILSYAVGPGCAALVKSQGRSRRPTAVARHQSQHGAIAVAVLCVGVGTIFSGAAERCIVRCGIDQLDGVSACIAQGDGLPHKSGSIWSIGACGRRIVVGGIADIVVITAAGEDRD